MSKNCERWERKEGRVHMVEVEPIVATNEVVELWLEKGKKLMMRNILLHSKMKVDKEL